MMERTEYVSPKTGRALYRDRGSLVTDDRAETYRVSDDGIVELFDAGEADAATQHEITVFDGIDLKGISYFAASVYDDVLRCVRACGGRYEGFAEEDRIVELGGGEGHWAASIQRLCPQARVYVCDISRHELSFVRDPLVRVRADVTRPLFADNAMTVAAFFVSLHHIPQEKVAAVFNEAYRMLRPGGTLIVFEPNAHFFPRTLMYRSFLRHDVYHDEERALDFNEVTRWACAAGFRVGGVSFLNPRYNPAFIRKLKRWWLYYGAVVALDMFDRVLTWCGIAPDRPFRRWCSLYGCAVFTK